MKILFVVHQFLPSSVAGTEVYTYRLAKHLQRDHDVRLLYGELAPTRPQYETETGEFDGLPYTRMIYNYRVESFPETYRNGAAEQVFLDEIDRFQPDLVHIQHLDPWSTGLPELARVRGIPVVYTLHEYAALCPAGGQMILPDLRLCDGPAPDPCGACIRERVEAGRPPGAAGRSPRDEAALRARAYRDLAEHVSLFISPSEFLKKTFVDAGFPADRILATDNGFDVEPFAELERPPSDVIRFGYVGAMVPHKGVHVAVDAFNELGGEGWEFHVYGGVRPDSPHARYQDRIRERAVDPKIHIHGAFRPDEVAGVYANVDVLVVPSVWVENSPLTIHEAFVAEVPVLASNFGGMAELIEDGRSGLLFERDDPASLRAAARRILDEPGLLAALRAGIPHVKTMDEHGVEMREIYRRVQVRPWSNAAEADAAKAAVGRLPLRAELARGRSRLLGVRERLNAFAGLPEAVRQRDEARSVTDSTSTAHEEDAVSRRGLKGWWRKLLGRG